MILSSVFGGVLSLVALLPQIPSAINILLDIIFASFIVLISFGKTTAKNFIKRLILYFSLSFTFCGFMIFIYTTFHPKGIEIYNDVVYFNISPPLLIILTLICYYILKLTKRLTKGVCGVDTCIVEISTNNQIHTFYAKVDTGCNLKEPFSGDYVIIVEKILLSDFTPDKTRVIPFNSLGGDGLIEGFKPDFIKINETEQPNNIYIGICNNILKGDAKALIPYELVKYNQ